MVELWRIRLLGGLSAFQGERAVTRFRTQRTGELLGYLAFYGARIHPREVLMDVLWPDSELDAARNSLSVALHSLRRQLEPPATTGSAEGAVLITDRNTIQLRPAAFITDVSAFETALEQAATAEGQETIEYLSQAEQLYTGELLPGLYNDWVVAERERLADAHRQALRRLTTLLMQVRDFDRALHYAHRAVREDSRNESARRLLMRLYAAMGRPAGVLEQLREFEHVLEATGEPFSAGLREFALRLAEGTDKETEGNVVLPSTVPASPAATPVSPLKTEAGKEPENFRLPMPFTRFFGRAEEMGQITHLLQTGTARLVTLVGPGGVGKTRLSVEVATRLRENQRFPGGMWFVSLVDLEDPRRLFEVVRDTLRLNRSASALPQQQVIEYLSARKRPCLLVLDNLEHLLGHGSLDTAGGAWVVEVLLARIPHLSVLVTSRVALGNGGERVFAVAPLPVPAVARPEYDTVRESPSISLFVDRAQARRVDFQITPRNAESIVRLCARLEGLPLAIELAAARAKIYTPSQMLDQLETGGWGTLDSKRTDIPARHRGLWTAAAWSYNLLTPAVRRLFAHLSVFRGRWSVAAAKMVCSEIEDDPDQESQTLDGLTRLRDASLLITETISIGPKEEMRLRLLEPLREFAAEQIPASERHQWERRHALYFLELAEEAARNLQGPEQHVWFDRLEADHDNFRAALTRFAEDEIGLRLAGSLARFWTIRGYLEEGTDWLNQVLEVNPKGHPTIARARALNAAGSLAYERGSFDTARAYYQESLEASKHLSDPVGAGFALSNLGNVAYRQGDYPTARAHYQESLAEQRAANHAWGIASALGNLANVAHSEGDLAVARRLHQESLALSREIGETRMTAYTLHNLGNAAVEEGNFAEARPFYTESLELKRSLGDRRGIAALLNSLGCLAMQEGDLDAAHAHFIEAIPLARDVGAQLSIITNLEGLAWHASVTRNNSLAAELWLATAAARQALKTPRQPSEHVVYNPFIAETVRNPQEPPLSIEEAIRRVLDKHPT